MAKPKDMATQNLAPSGIGGGLIDRTLAEQMKITEREIAARKALLKFTPEEEHLLRDLQPLIVDHIDDIVNAFYAQLTAFDEVQLVIGDAETFNRLHSSMRRYILELFDGVYDWDYVNKRLRIGKIHERIGVSPKLYVSAMSMLEIGLQKVVTAPGSRDGDAARGEAAREALHKLLMFDVQFVFDTYIGSLVSEVETAKRQVEAYAAGLEDTIAERTRQLRDLSRKDTLTGLFNQLAFYEHLRRELARAERNCQPIALIYMDLNNFKQVNDREGHRVGDRVLAAVGRAIGETIRAGDIGCRYGGDEFCLILGATGAEDAHALAQRLTAAFDPGANKGVSFSIGIAQTGPDAFLDNNDFVRCADQAMYRAKAGPELGHKIFVAQGREDSR